MLRLRMHRDISYCVRMEAQSVLGETNEQNSMIIPISRKNFANTLILYAILQLFIE